MKALVYLGTTAAAMATSARPESPSVAICGLHPTQMMVGYREVGEKRRRWRAASTAGGGAVRSRVVPVVLGPGDRCYILDLHHWLCAVAAEGVAKVPVAVADDLRALDRAAFWRTLDRRGWRRSHDAVGRRQDCGGIPDPIAGLKDDPFRSLASALRRAGGYAKHDAPFSDFLWADLLRHHIPAKLIDDDFDAALREALALASEAGLDGTDDDIAGAVHWQKLRTTAASSPPSLQD